MTTLIEPPPTPAKAQDDGATATCQPAAATCQPATAACQPGPEFAFKGFQVDDMARAAMHDGLVLGWEPRMGKTLVAYVWPELKKARHVLLVVPEQLHVQFIEEGARFGHTPRPLMSLADFHNDPILVRAALDAATGEPFPTDPDQGGPIFWLTSYSALGYNGGDMWEPRERQDGEIIVNQAILGRRQAHPLYRAELDHGIGTETERQDGGTIRCVFQPTLAMLCAQLFDCVVCDEGVRLKSDASHCSLGVRMMTAKFRLVLTATAIKNLLESVFWLCQWACNGGSATRKAIKEPTARWPYADTNEAHEMFANEHMLIEQNKTREAEHQAATGRFKQFRKRTSQICNIHRLWKLLAPVVLRRRKEDTGEEIVPKTIIPIQIKPGTAQQRVYQFHLDNPPTVAKNGNPMGNYSAIMAQMQNLRQAALCPDSPNLAARPAADSPPDASKHARSWTDFNPKQAAILRLIEQEISKGEQVVIMSPFQQFSLTLHRRLREAGVSACLLDGNIHPKKRGQIAAQFKKKRFAVLVAGQKAMGEGNSFECASVLILPSLDWAFDINKQSIERVWGIVSKKAVRIYLMVTENTIDKRLESTFRERGDSSSLALDGRLFSEQTHQVNLGQLLADAIHNFDPAAETIPETDIEKEWNNSQRQRLGVAERLYREFHPPIIPDITGDKVTAAEVRQAFEQLNSSNDAGAATMTAIVNCIPSATIGALIGSADRTIIDATRAAFSAFCVETRATDWRRAWQPFEAAGTIGKIMKGRKP